MHSEMRYGKAKKVKSWPTLSQVTHEANLQLLAKEELLGLSGGTYHISRCVALSLVLLSGISAMLLIGPLARELFMVLSTSGPRRHLKTEIACNETNLNALKRTQNLGKQDLTLEIHTLNEEIVYQKSLLKNNWEDPFFLNKCKATAYGIGLAACAGFFILSSRKVLEQGLPTQSEIFKFITATLMIDKQVGQKTPET